MSVKSSAETYVRSAAVTTATARGTFARLADFAELSKPRIAALALVTVAVGYTLGNRSAWSFGGAFDCLLGVGLVAAACGALNQLLERHADSEMQRTMHRPLPAGRILPFEALAFGAVSAVTGFAWLAVRVNLLTAVLSVAALALYILVYTPLKRKTHWCTTLGAIPGALPPVLGWTAARGRLDVEALALFALLLVWQFPHFLSIAWLYRHDYAKAGLRMLPGSHLVGPLAVGLTVLLGPLSLLPAWLGMAGTVYVATALLFWLVYLRGAVWFWRDDSVRSARGLLWSSLVYLPALLGVLTVDHLRLLL